MSWLRISEKTAFSTHSWTLCQCPYPEISTEDATAKPDMKSSSTTTSSGPSPLLLALANKKCEMAAHSFWAQWTQNQKSNASVQYNPILALIRPNSFFGLLRNNPGFLDLSTLFMLQNLVNNNNKQVSTRYKCFKYTKHWMYFPYFLQ